jgi:phosphate transport system permease protein
MTAFFLMLGTLPATAVGGAALFEWLGRRGLLRQSARGYEFLLMIPLVVVGVWLTFQAGWLFDRYVLGTSLPTWLFDTLNVRVDQRNAIIIAIALGFAVLPTVFTLSDDALTNVPRNLTAASLALGATRWQTVTRVVLPSASPGVFAALMVGLGRAVGETMIVLMATGNTPILDWSVFNGMRTLSANIAVEIPEAPLDGTLYRTLFLSGVLLFVTTFLLNSVAEVVRIRLRKKFGQY